MIKFMLKVLVLPVLLVLNILSLVADIGMKIYCHGAGFVINVIIVLGIFALIGKNWTGVGIFTATLGVVVVIALGIGILGAIIQTARDAVKGFIVS